jgi:EmrB/QacA subfamily drug resistance transporter
VFTVGSAAAALAPTVQALIAARALQGVGAALYMPLTLTILAAAAPQGRLGAALGAWGSLGALGGALGPPLGGALTAGPGWQWIFWLNVPLGMVLVPLALRHLPDSHGPHARLDLPGVGLGSTALVGIVCGVVGGNAAGWTSPRTLLALGAGLLALVAFLAWERRAPAPMLPLRLFAHRGFAAANLSSLLMYAAMFGGVFLVAQLFQTGLGAGPLESGLRTLPMVGAPLLLSPVAGTLSDRVGARPLMVLAAAVEAVALAWLALVARPGVDYGLLLPALVLMGAGAALFFAPLATVTLGAVAPPEHGIASGTTTAVRELAVVLGVAVLGSVFARFGGFGSPEQFAAGFAAALGVAAALAAAAGLAALALPREPVPQGVVRTHRRPEPALAA